jgi:hypothetical protein
MYKYLLIVLLMPLSLQVMGEGWTPTPKKISGIIIEGAEDSGTALIILEGGVPSANIPTTCNSIYNTVSLKTEKGRGILSVALAAKMAGQPVRLALGTCSGTRPLITHIWL